MDEKALYWTSIILGALALLFLVANVILIDSNRNLQQQAISQQGEINGGATLSRLNESLVQALAQAVVKDDDRDIRDLLTGQGITIRAAAKPEPAKDTK